ncbi:hypothetical protein ED551_14450, partial [Muribaculaceae bacterium Isolate-013 (NCI)]
ADGHTLTIRADGLSENSRYVAGIEIDGVAHNGNFLSWDDISNAREIVFRMTD